MAFKLLQFYWLKKLKNVIQLIKITIYNFIGCLYLPQYLKLMKKLMKINCSELYTVIRVKSD